jgi:hypothetical protein
VEIPPRPIKPPLNPPPPSRIVMAIASPYIKQQIVSMAYVTGEVCGIHRLSDRLAAAKENVMLAPH